MLKARPSATHLSTAVVQKANARELWIQGPAWETYKLHLKGLKEEEAAVAAIQSHSWAIRRRD